eukprot:403358935
MLKVRDQAVLRHEAMQSENAILEMKWKTKVRQVEAKSKKIDKKYESIINALNNSNKQVHHIDLFNQNLKSIENRRRRRSELNNLALSNQTPEVSNNSNSGINSYVPYFIISKDRFDTNKCDKYPEPKLNFYTKQPIFSRENQGGILIKDPSILYHKEMTWLKRMERKNQKSGSCKLNYDASNYQNNDLEHLNDFSIKMFGFHNSTYSLQNIAEMMIRPALTNGTFEQNEQIPNQKLKQNPFFQEIKQIYTQYDPNKNRASVCQYLEIELTSFDLAKQAVLDLFNINENLDQVEEITQIDQGICVNNNQFQNQGILRVPKHPYKNNQSNILSVQLLSTLKKEATELIFKIKRKSKRQKVSHLQPNDCLTKLSKKKKLQMLDDKENENYSSSGADNLMKINAPDKNQSSNNSSSLQSMSNSNSSSNSQESSHVSSNLMNDKDSGESKLNFNLFNLGDDNNSKDNIQKRQTFRKVNIDSEEEILQHSIIETENSQVLVINSSQMSIRTKEQENVDNSKSKNVENINNKIEKQQDPDYGSRQLTKGKVKRKLKRVKSHLSKQIRKKKQVISKKTLQPISKTKIPSVRKKVYQTNSSCSQHSSYSDKKRRNKKRSSKKSSIRKKFVKTSIPQHSSSDFQNQNSEINASLSSEKIQSSQENKVLSKSHSQVSSQPSQTLKTLDVNQKQIKDLAPKPVVPSVMQPLRCRFMTERVSQFQRDSESSQSQSLNSLSNSNSLQQFQAFWSREEKDLYIEQLKLFGRDWKKIQESLPKKSWHQIKNYWINYYRKLNLYQYLPKQNTENDSQKSNNQAKNFQNNDVFNSSNNSDNQQDNEQEKVQNTKKNKNNSNKNIVEFYDSQLSEKIDQLMVGQND